MKRQNDKKRVPDLRRAGCLFIIIGTVIWIAILSSLGLVYIIE